MDRTSRPVVVAALVQDEQGYCFKTSTKRIELKPEAVEAVKPIVDQANGCRSIVWLANEDHDEETLVALFTQFEELGICYDAHHVAMYGHQAARYPDPLRVYPGDKVVLQLMELPSDRDGQVISVVGDSGTPYLEKRQTRRSFTDEPVTFGDLSRIAYAAYGITGPNGNTDRRTVPSAGAMYPLQIDYIIRRGDGIDPGIYRWAKRQNGFIPYGSVTDEALQDAFNDSDWRCAAVIQVIGFDISRSAAKYSSRAHRFALLEAGHVAQNSILRATSLDLGVWEHGNYADDRLMELVELQGATSGIGTVLFYGHPPVL